MSEQSPDSYRILIVDDDDVDRELIERSIMSSGLAAQIDQAQDLPRAMRQFESQEYHCIIIDYRIGPHDGFDLLKEMQQVRRHMPGIIMLTGMGNEDIAVRAMKRGVHDYISKDEIDGRELADAIRAATEDAASMARKNDQDEMLRQLSLYDQLTGLPNRNLFVDRFNTTIEACRRHQTGFAVLLMDLDGFKAINDNHGHQTGDEVLNTVGQRLQQTARDSDTFARMGGDEFTAILPDTESIEGAITIARKLLDAVNQPLAVDDKVLHVGLSIGIALYPQHGTDTNTLLHNADQAMYSAKRAHHGYTVFDDEAIDSCSHRATQIAEALPDICKDDSLVMCYQPKVALDSGSPVGAEVLIRWQHPELGLLPPAEFVPAAERSSVIRDLTYRVIELAAVQVASWREMGIEMPLAVNMSTRILADHDVPVRIMRILDSHDVPARALTLEITESALITDRRRARKMLESLAAEGLHISVDDFGTGYSSLKYLREFPFHELKIDRTFVAHVMDQGHDISIIEAIVRLAKGFNARCVAEGIEDRQTWEKLRQLGCDIGQGYAISKPLEANDFLDWWQLWRLQDRLEIAGG